MKSELDNIRVAITSDSMLHRSYLQKAMEQGGIHIVMNDALSSAFITKLENHECDVLILDMDAVSDEHLEYVDILLEQTDIPVIINDVSGLTLNEPVQFNKWHNQLLGKVADITGRSSWEALENKATSQPQQMSKSVPAADKLATNVWILGASLGGPDALKRFLKEIPENLPVAFIVAQHLGANFVARLAEQLDRSTHFNVSVAEDGHVLRHQEVLITPTHARLTINPIGAVVLEKVDDDLRYTPSIDTLITDMAKRYKDRTGAIIFSGMCDDGVIGCKNVAAQEGQVWVQDPESCVVSAMSESVAKSVAVNFTGSPEKLAEKLIAYYV